MVTPAEDGSSEPYAGRVDGERVVVAGLDEAQPSVQVVADASEGDALDQGRVVAPRAVFHAPSPRLEASEGDVLDQAREVPLDEDLDGWSAEP